MLHETFRDIIIILIVRNIILYGLWLNSGCTVKYCLSTFKVPSGFALRNFLVESSWYEYNCSLARKWLFIVRQLQDDKSWVWTKWIVLSIFLVITPGFTGILVLPECDLAAHDCYWLNRAVKGCTWVYFFCNIIFSLSLKNVVICNFVSLVFVFLFLA